MSPSVLVSGRVVKQVGAAVLTLEAGPVDPAASLLLEFPICTPPVMPCSLLLLFLNLSLVKWAHKCWLPGSEWAWHKTPSPHAWKAGLKIEWAFLISSMALIESPLG